MSIRVTEPKFKKTLAWLERLSKLDVYHLMNDFGRKGVTALSKATPKDSGEAANAWRYEIRGSKGKYKLIWTNSKIVGGVPLVIMLQYGHATKSNTYVAGRDFINPALDPIFRDLKRKLEREVFG